MAETMDRGDCGNVGLFVAKSVHARRIADALDAAGFRLSLLPDPFTHFALWRDAACDVLIFDPSCYTGGATAAMRLMRGVAGEIPIMALTSDDCPMQRTAALLSGADDAMFARGDPREIVARTGALNRRCRVGKGQVIVCDDLEIDLVNRHVARAGLSIAMPLREFDLLAHLARRRDCPVSRPALLKAVWRLDFDPGTNRIDVHVSRLRQRVDQGHGHAMLRTIKGFGYSLVSRIGAAQMDAARCAAVGSVPMPQAG